MKIIIVSEPGLPSRVMEFRLRIIYFPRVKVENKWLALFLVNVVQSVFCKPVGKQPEISSPAYRYFVAPQKRGGDRIFGKIVPRDFIFEPRRFRNPIPVMIDGKDA